MDAIVMWATCPLIAQGLAPVVGMARTVAIIVTAFMDCHVTRSAENVLVFPDTLANTARIVSFL